MAVLCPMYDKDLGWYIVVDGKKQLFSSLLYYYYSLGVSPPVGATITQDDIDDFEIDLSIDNEDPDYDDLDYSPTYLGSSMPKPLNLPPSVQFQPIPNAGFASLFEDVNQTPSYTPMALPPSVQFQPIPDVGFASLFEDVNQTPSYTPMPLPNNLSGPSTSFSSYQHLSHAYPNQSVPMTDSYMSSYLSAMLPLPLSTHKVVESEAMEILDYEDEFEEEDSFMYDYSSVKSSSNSEISCNNTV